MVTQVVFKTILPDGKQIHEGVELVKQLQAYANYSGFEKRKL